MVGFGLDLRFGLALSLLLSLLTPASCYATLGWMLDGLRVGPERGFGLGFVSGLQSYVVWLVRLLLWLVVLSWFLHSGLLFERGLVHVRSHMGLCRYWSVLVLLVILSLVLRFCLSSCVWCFCDTASSTVLLVLMLLDLTVGFLLRIRSPGLHSLAVLSNARCSARFWLGLLCSWFLDLLLAFGIGSAGEFCLASGLVDGTRLSTVLVLLLL